MKKNRFGDTKGITLIALVVTIIIMLIMAGISISAILGNNGLLEKAIYTKEASTIGKEKDHIQIEVMGSFEPNGKLLAGTLKEHIEKYLEAEVSGDEFPLTVTFIETGHSYTIDAKGNIQKID